MQVQPVSGPTVLGFDVIWIATCLSAVATFAVLTAIYAATTVKDPMARRVKALNERREQLKAGIVASTNKRKKLTNKNAAADKVRGILSNFKMLQDEQVKKTQQKLMQAGIRNKELAFFIIAALAWIYLEHHDLPVVAGIFYGIKPAVTAVVLHAAIRIGGRALRSHALRAVAVLAFVAIFAFDLPFPWIVLGAGLMGLCGAHLLPDQFRADPPPALEVLERGGAEDETDPRAGVLGCGDDPGRVRPRQRALGRRPHDQPLRNRRRSRVEYLDPGGVREPGSLPRRARSSISSSLRTFCKSRLLN